MMLSCTWRFYQCKFKTASRPSITFNITEWLIEHVRVIVDNFPASTTEWTNMDYLTTFRRNNYSAGQSRQKNKTVGKYSISQSFPILDLYSRTRRPKYPPRFAKSASILNNLTWFFTIYSDISALLACCISPARSHKRESGPSASLFHCADVCSGQEFQIWFKYASVEPARYEDLSKAYLTGWWFEPLWKILVNWDYYPNINGKIRNGNQTTNQ